LPSFEGEFGDRNTDELWTFLTENEGKEVTLRVKVEPGEPGSGPPCIDEDSPPPKRIYGKVDDPAANDMIVIEFARTTGPGGEQLFFPETNWCGRYEIYGRFRVTRTGSRDIQTYVASLVPTRSS
jgi:hypothetical protein